MSHEFPIGCDTCGKFLSPKEFETHACATPPEKKVTSDLPPRVNFYNGVREYADFDVIPPKAEHEGSIEYLSLQEAEADKAKAVAAERERIANLVADLFPGPHTDQKIYGAIMNAIEARAKGGSDGR